MRTICLLALLLPTTTFAQRTKANSFYKQGVEAELAQNATQRELSFQQALEVEPGFALARWHLGFVLHQNDWRTPQQVSDIAKQHPFLEAYLKRRSERSPSASSALELSSWCEENGLHDYAEAHLQLALKFDPENALAHRKLGHLKYDGSYVSPGQLAKLKAFEQRRKVAARLWERRIRSLASDLKKSGSESTEAAKRQLIAIDDPWAIESLDEVLGTRSEVAAKILVEVLSNISHTQADLVLLRNALWSTWETVRQDAKQQLLKRDLTTFMPILIDNLRPTESGVQWVPGFGEVWRWQNLTTNYTYLRFYMNERQLRALRSLGIERIRNLDQGDRRGRLFAAVQQENETRKSRSLDILRDATGIESDWTYYQWKKWWAPQVNQYYSIAFDKEPERTNEVTSEQYISSVGIAAPSVFPRASCFVSGTPVWTKRGLVAIDHIQPGDLILSQDLETAELSYRPALETSIRPLSEAIQCTVDGEKIGMTINHPIWVAGRGWKRADELNEGTLVRGVDRLLTVERIEPAGRAEAYNLVVADNANYFVGKNALLVHDVTPVTDFPPVVPGMKQP